jgi:hypothetical protein
MACNRANAAEALANIPTAEQPTSDELEGYVQVFPGNPSIAWGDKFVQLCAWLNDYDVRRRRKEKPESQFDNPNDVGRYNFAR